MKRDSLCLEVTRVETDDDVEDDEREGPKPRTKVYRVSARLGDQEWSVFRQEEEFHNAGLKGWVAKAKNKAESFIQPILETKSMLTFLDPTTAMPPAYGFTLPEKTGVLNLFVLANKRWSPRYVVLSSGRLYCYRSQKSGAPSSIYDLVCYTIDQAKEPITISTTPHSEPNLPSSTHSSPNINGTNVRASAKESGGPSISSSFSTSTIASINNNDQASSPRQYHTVSYHSGIFVLTHKGNRILFDAGTETSMRDWVISSRKSREQMNTNLNLTYSNFYKEVNKNEVEDAIKKFKEEEQTRVLLDFASDDDQKSNIPLARQKRANAFRQLRLSMVAPLGSTNSPRITSPRARGGGGAQATSARRSSKGKKKVKVYVERLNESGNRPKSQSPLLVEINKNGSDTPQNTLYNENGKLKGAILKKLLQILCDHTIPAENFTNVFLLTYPWFISSMKLFSSLTTWWFECETKEASDVVLIRERIANILIKWVELQWNVFLSVKELTTNLVQFLNFTANDQTMSTLQAAWLKNLIRYKCGSQTTETLLKEKTEPILPKIFDSGCFGTLDIDSVEIARQLTLVQSELYNKLSTDEFVSQKWIKEPSESPNIINCIHRFNKISGWATEFVLQWPTPDQRGTVLAKLIDIAYECAKLRNYETVVQIMSGIENASVSRMKLSWARVPDKFMNKLQELRTLFKPTENWKNYRAELSTSEIPSIPYLGLFLQSLIFTEDGNHDYIQPPLNLINWTKCNILSSIMSDILKFQQSQYPITPVPEIINLFVLENFTARNDRELFQKSVEIEPRTTDTKNRQIKTHRRDKSSEVKQASMLNSSREKSNLNSSREIRNQEKKGIHRDTKPKSMADSMKERECGDKETNSVHYEIIDDGSDSHSPKKGLEEEQHLRGAGGGGGFLDKLRIRNKSMKSKAQSSFSNIFSMTASKRTAPIQIASKSSVTKIQNDQDDSSDPIVSASPDSHDSTIPSALLDQSSPTSLRKQFLRQFTIGKQGNKGRGKRPQKDEVPKQVQVQEDPVPKDEDS